MKPRYPRHRSDYSEVVEDNYPAGKREKENEREREIIGLEVTGRDASAVRVTRREAPPFCPGVEFAKAISRGVN